VAITAYASEDTDRTTVLGFFRTHYSSHTRGVLAAALATALAAMAEASALVMIVPLAERATRADGEVLGRIGPFSLEMGTGQLLGLVTALIVVSVAFKVLALWLRTRTVRSWEQRARVRALRLLLEADYEHTARLAPSELQAVVGSHVGQAAAGLSVIGQIANAAISLAVLVLVAFATAPVAALVIAVVGGGLLALLRPLARRTREAGKASSELGIESNRLVADTARDGREIRLYGAQNHFLDQYSSAVTRHAVNQTRLNMISGLAPVLYHGAGLLLVVVAIALALSVGDLEVTTLGSVALLFLRSLGYGQQLASTLQQYNQTVPFADRLAAELSSLAEARERSGDLELRSVESIELRNVGYLYAGAEADQAALEHVDVVLRSPGIVGLVGASGSGKSTLAQLLLRLRHPSSGQVLVNGRDIAEWSRGSWATQVALVPQSPQLLRGSVRDNIAFFRPGIDEERVRQVARSVGLDGLFDSLPDGYDTELGETGRELSGGQLQRIGIARALAGDPSLLVLDEPTSALDIETEQWVQRAIKEAGLRALVVVITHRETTLGICDRVLRLEAGRLVADTYTHPAGPD
jgi:ABC-type multidrug transport system fused ATPase/permease subunit